MNYMEKINGTINFINSLSNIKPTIGLVLGSGLGSLGERIQKKISVEYKDIPNFPVSTVEGHKGQLILGQLGGKNVIAMQGRFHYYEGYPLWDVVFLLG